MNKFIIKTVIFLIWISCLNLNAQQSPMVLTTEAFLDFESCEGGTIEFVDEGLSSQSGLKIANWEESFTVTGEEWLAADFVELDNDRFYVKVKLVDSDLSQIVVNLRSYAAGIDPNTTEDYANYKDQIEALPLIRMQDNNGEFIYRSRALLLVTDDDRSDDDLKNATYSTLGHDESVYDGVDDQSTDKTIYAPLQGKLYIRYTSLNNEVLSGLVNVCNEEVLKVKLNIVSLINPETGFTYVSSEDLINLFFGIAQKTYAQTCILFVDKDGNSLDPSDVIEVIAPEELNIALGIHASNQGAISMDEQIIWNALNDNSPSTIDIFIVNQLLDMEGMVMNSNGESFNDKGAIFIAINPILFYGGYLGIPHEIGHILTNNGHYGLAYATSATDAQIMRNLMKGFGTTDGNDLLYSSRRLTDAQIESIRGVTSIPY